MQQNTCMDWVRLRQRLGDYRRAAGLEEIDLAGELGAAKSTVYRAENVDDLPDYRPDLDTIEAWLLKTDGPSLSVFFAELATDDPGAERVTSAQSQPVPVVESSGKPQETDGLPVALSTGTHEQIPQVPIPVGAPPFDARTAHVLSAIAYAITHALSAPDAQRKVGGDRQALPARTDRTGVAGGRNTAPRETVRKRR